MLRDLLVKLSLEDLLSILAAVILRLGWGGILEPNDRRAANALLDGDRDRAA